MEWLTAPGRAVFDVECGKLGRCQIDALYPAQRFDRIVRTEQPLNAHLRREIRELYMAARDTAGPLGARAGEWVSCPSRPEPAGRAAA